MHRYLVRPAARLSAALLLALLAIAVLAPPAQAQGGVEWRERATANFTILYGGEGGAAEAERYAAFVDEVYEEIAAIFSFRTATPLTLRLYPTSEDYYLVNPAARNVPGVVAHADFRRRELVVIVERTRQQTEVELQNNIRHELTHIVAGDLSENRLNTGFQEGVAQYLERPSGELERRIQALRASREQGLLLPWSAFDEREQIYGAPEVSYPQTLSVVAFLVDRDGFAKLRELLTVTARSSGYRSALERVYGASPAELESEWLDWLPGYLDGGYQRSALESYDLGYAEELITGGNYAAAQAELTQALEWLRKQEGTAAAAGLDEAEALLARSEDGMRGEQMAESARESLEQADYGRALEFVAAARTVYARLGDTRQEQALAIYEQRAKRGLLASERLAQADTLASQLRYPQARAVADTAAAEFAALGDSLRRDNALSLRSSMDERQRLFGFALVALGLVGVAVSLLGQLFRRQPEAW
jgi:hypothetical protein